MPANTGIHRLRAASGGTGWIPARAGMTETAGDDHADPPGRPRSRARLQGRAGVAPDGRAVRAAAGRSRPAARAAQRGLPRGRAVRRGTGVRRRGRCRGLPAERDPRRRRAPLRQARRTHSGRSRARARMAGLGSEPARDELAAPAFLASLHARRSGARGGVGSTHAVRPRPSRRGAARSRVPARRMADDRRRLLLRLPVPGRPGRRRSRDRAGDRRMARPHPLAAWLAGAV